MSSRLYELMDEYEEMFDDIFPLMSTKGMSSERIEAEIKRCLETGTPYKTDPKAIY